MNFWTFLDRNSLGLFWIALALIGSASGVVGTYVANLDHRCQCQEEAK